MSVAISGLAALAVAMGIGRFAFTPILPLMQEDAGLTLAGGGWLASANYAGYLIGALSVIRGRLRPDFAVRIGLLTIACTTLAMGFEQRFLAWAVLRVLPGFASAWVLVYMSAWALEKLASSGRAHLGGIVYAGVGAGIVVAGGTCLVLSAFHLGSSQAWIALGAMALAATVVLWNRVGSAPAGASAAPAAPHVPVGEIPEFWRLVLCYGAYGLGYIIPATFLPVMAKQAIADPRVFGWAWPVVGAAAVLSTLVAARATRVIGLRGVWIASNLILAAGALVPIALPTLSGIAIAALCVGGTFVVLTMVGFQEARRVAGVHARTLMAAMTSAFALGQIVGPLLVSGLVGVPGGFSYALAAAAVPLFLATYALYMSPERRKR